MHFGIFICYRRDDAIKDARAIYERLVREFGAESVFMDIEALVYGDDFVDALKRQLEQCTVVLVLIGPRWLTAANADGSRRLDDPADYVRLELVTSLARKGVRVVPVLLDGAALPKEEELPDPLRPLVRRHALELRDASFDADIGRLTARLRRIGTIAAATSQRAENSREVTPVASGSPQSPPPGEAFRLVTEHPLKTREREPSVHAGAPAAVESGTPTRGNDEPGLPKMTGPTGPATAPWWRRHLLAVLVLLIVFGASLWSFNRGGERAGAAPAASSTERAPVVDVPASMVPGGTSPAVSRPPAPAQVPLELPGDSTASKCMQSDPFAYDRLAEVRQTLSDVGIAATDHTWEWRELAGLASVYMGRFASEEALRQKQDELSRLKVPSTPVAAGNVELYPGLTLGTYSSREQAETALGVFVNWGVRGARVVVLAEPRKVAEVRLLASDAQIARLRDHPTFLSWRIKIAPCAGGR